MKKNLILLFIVFLLSGCTVDYQLTIDKDGKVSEDARAMEDKEFFKEYSKSSIGRVVGFLIDPYSEELNKNNYNTNTIINSDTGGANLSKQYDSVEDYSKNTKLVGQFSDKVIYKEDGSKVTLSVKGKLSDQEQNQDKFPIDSATIIIELPFEVTENNADKIVGRKYVWNLESGKEKEIKIVYNKNKIAKDNENNIVIYVLIGAVVLIIIGIIAVFNIKSKREEMNKI